MIIGLEELPSNYFWKCGKLWSYVNVEDELWFAVFTLTFNRKNPLYAPYGGNFDF
jgi:hypothetical protein